MTVARSDGCAIAASVVEVAGLGPQQVGPDVARRRARPPPAARSTTTSRSAGSRSRTDEHATEELSRPRRSPRTAPRVAHQVRDLVGRRRVVDRDRRAADAAPRRRRPRGTRAGCASSARPGRPGRPRAPPARSRAASRRSPYCAYVISCQSSPACQRRATWSPWSGDRVAEQRGDRLALGRLGDLLVRPAHSIPLRRAAGAIRSRRSGRRPGVAGDEPGDDAGDEPGDDLGTTGRTLGTTLGTTADRAGADRARHGPRRIRRTRARPAVVHTVVPRVDAGRPPDVHRSSPGFSTAGGGKPDRVRHTAPQPPRGVVGARIHVRFSTPTLLGASRVPARPRPLGLVELGEHRLGVGTERPARAADRTRRAGEAGDQARHRDAVDGHERLPGPDVLVGRDVGHASTPARSPRARPRTPR